MPSRIIREGINSSPRVNRLSPEAELMYRRLLLVADDYGRYYANPATVRGGCWPTHPSPPCEQTVSNLLAECQQPDSNLLTVYEVNGCKYLQLVGFGQKIRSKSKFPDPAGNMSAICQQPVDKVPALGVLRIADAKANAVISMPPSAEHLISETVQRMYQLHPKKKNLVLIPGALTSAVAMEADPKKKLEEIEAVHAAWCETYAWTEKNGNFAPPLAEWIADRGYTKWPRGREPTPKPANVLPDRKWDLLGDMRRDAEARKADEPDEETKAWYAKLDEEFMGKRGVKSQ